MKVDLKKDLFHIAYHAEAVTPERMLETIRAEGLRGEVVQATP